MSKIIRITFIILIHSGIIFSGTEDTTIQVLIQKDKDFSNPFIVLIQDNGRQFQVSGSLCSPNIIDRLPLFNIDRTQIYQLSNQSDSILGTICSFRKLEDFTSSFLFSNHTIQPNLLPTIENIFRGHFYYERKIRPTLWVIGAGTDIKDCEKISSPIQFNTKISKKDLQLHIIEAKLHQQDELFFQLKSDILQSLSVSEILLIENFIHSFFNYRLVRSKHLYCSGNTPVESMVNVRVPVYLPNIRLQTDQTFAKQIILQWPEISRAILKMVDKKQIEKSRDDLFYLIDLEINSPMNKLVFLVKLALQTGKIKSLSELRADLEQIDFSQIVQKTKQIFLQNEYDLFWFTGLHLDSAELEKIHVNFKFDHLIF